VNGSNIYIKSSQEGSFIGVNHFFNDDPNANITLVHPDNNALTWKANTDEAIKLVLGAKHYYLN
jgi:hypothetical protein